MPTYKTLNFSGVVTLDWAENGGLHVGGESVPNEVWTFLEDEFGTEEERRMIRDNMEYGNREETGLPKWRVKITVEAERIEVVSVSDLKEDEKLVYLALVRLHEMYGSGEAFGPTKVGCQVAGKTNVKSSPSAWVVPRIRKLIEYGLVQKVHDGKYRLVNRLGEK